MNTTEIEFNLCIPVEELINFIDHNSDFEWNDICDMEYKYRKSRDFENEEAYPIIRLGDYQDNEFHIWCENETLKQLENAGIKLYAEEVMRDDAFWIITRVESEDLKKANKIILNGLFK
jgi:hypothetical protein